MAKHLLAALTNEEAEAMAKRIRENPKAFGVEPFAEEHKEQYDFERMLSNADDVSPDVLVRHMLSSMGREGFNFLSAEYLQATQVLAILAVSDGLSEIARAISEDSQYS